MRGVPGEQGCDTNGCWADLSECRYALVGAMSALRAGAVDERIWHVGCR